MNSVDRNENLTPLMKQYEHLKAKHPGEILLFRLGDFYEMFSDDAKQAAPVLEVALTQRQGVPMCGIPYHAVDRYMARLLKNGLRVAIAEQLEDPATAKGIVKRDVTRRISAGTIVEEKLLSEKSNNFLAALILESAKGKSKGEKEWMMALAALDVSTGQLLITETNAGEHFSNLMNELGRVHPSEILLAQGTETILKSLDGIPSQILNESDFSSVEVEKYFPQAGAVQKLISQPLSHKAVKMILAYVQKMDPAVLSNLQPPQWTASSETMALDRETIENLEILRNSYDGSSDKTLLEFLDRTLTPMGGRLIKQWLASPLIDLKKIQERTGTVEFFVQESARLKVCREKIKGSSDIERITIRIASGRAQPRDMIALKLSLQKARELKSILVSTESAAPFVHPLPPSVQDLLSQISEWDELITLLDRAIVPEPPIFLQDGGVIRSGYDSTLDEKRQASEEGKSWLADLEKREREKTQITNLKIGYTSVFGYYFDITKSQLPKVPPHWHRKQTLVNAERYVNEELKNLEQKILGAEEQCLRIEKELFESVAGSIRKQSREIQSTARAIAELDCLFSFAETAETQSLTKPAMDDSDELSITDGWHPVVKSALPPGSFVPNDACLDSRQNQIIILTGPNMSGKSTYLRQTALIVLMAQVGSFVPAKEAHIGLVDRIFTRIGSGDRLAQGQSTFMVEMQETARILNHATSKSLIILDEVGRGTSTYDGVSIAWAVIEYLTKLKPKVLFATHYFELTHLANEMEGVKNYNVQAKEWQETLLFLHKIVPGPADRSYGIHVAQLAGLPAEVVQRSKKLLKQLENEHLSLLKSKSKTGQEWFQFSND